MPGIDGFDATAAIVAEEASRRVVVLSGSADPGDIARRRERLGLFGYLTEGPYRRRARPWRHLAAAES